MNIAPQRRFEYTFQERPKRKNQSLRMFIITAVLIFALGIFLGRIYRLQPAFGDDPFVNAALSTGASNIIVVRNVTTTPQGLEFYFVNRSQAGYNIDPDQFLAVFIDDAWQRLPPENDIPLPAVNTFGDPNHSRIDFIPRYGELQAGRYMFIRGHSPHDSPDSRREFVLIEFNIP